MDDTERLMLPVATGSLALPEGPVLFLNARAGPGLDAIPPTALVCEQGLKPLHDGLAAQGLSVSPRAAPHAPGGYAAAFVLLARNRVQSLGLIARAAVMTAAGGPVVVSGARTDGAEAALVRLREAVPLAGVLAKAHGKTFWFPRPDPLPAVIATWEAAAAPRRNAAGFVTAPGMFSHDHADPGSALLAEALAGRLSGRVAELGAGWGWLAAGIMAHNPAVTVLDLFEADHAALEAARANLADPRARFRWQDVTLLAAADGPFDHVVANPPVHAGRATEPALGIAFIEAARRLLTPSGRLHLVANRQLPYEATLGRLFAEWAPAGGSPAYKVLTAARPRKALVRQRR